MVPFSPKLFKYGGAHALSILFLLSTEVRQYTMSFYYLWGNGAGPRSVKIFASRCLLVFSSPSCLGAISLKGPAAHVRLELYGSLRG